MKKGMFLLIFGIFLVITFLSLASAEKLGISIENNFLKTGDINFIVTIYDNSGNKIDGEADYNIRDYYSDIIASGKAGSGKKVNYKLPENPVQGPWEISARYGGAEAKELFNIGELKKVDVKIEGDNLIIKNIGNVFFDNNILIYIGNNDQTARIYLEVGQEKRIKLTAPSGVYNVRVSSDGTRENEKVFSDVSLTGNVIGLERVSEGNFFTKYPLITLFLVVLVIVVIAVYVIKGRNKDKNKSKNRKK